MMNNLWFEKGRDRILNAVSAGNIEEACATVDVGINHVGHTKPRGAFLSGAVSGIAAILGAVRAGGWRLEGKTPADLDGWMMRAESAIHRKPDLRASAQGKPSPLSTILAEGLVELKAYLDAGVRITAQPPMPSAAKVELSEVVRGPDGLITGVIKRPVSAAVASAVLHGDDE
jgi:hypothetical protein